MVHADVHLAAMAVVDLERADAFVRQGIPVRAGAISDAEAIARSS